MMTELAGRVSAQPFFAGLPPAMILQLCAYGEPVTLQADRRVFFEGETAERFWLLESGTVALGLHVPGHGDQIVETVGAGAVLGWSWLYPPYRWQFGAVTRSPVTGIAFDAAALRERCDADPALGYALLLRFTPVIVDRLQAARLRLLDLWGAPGRRVAP